MIGMGSIVLDGAIIEDGALVGAGTVVPPNKRVKANHLVIGNPMKVIRELTKQEQIDIGLNKDFYLKLMSEYE